MCRLQLLGQSIGCRRFRGFLVSWMTSRRYLLTLTRHMMQTMNQTLTVNTLTTIFQTLQCTIEYVPETELDITSTDSDCRIVDTDTHFDTQSTDTTPVLHDYSFLPQRHPQTTPKRPKTADDSTPVLFIYPTTDDTTPPLTNRETLKWPTETHNTHDSDSSDTTPLLHLQTDHDTLIRQKQPKRLFTSTDTHQEHRWSSCTWTSQLIFNGFSQSHIFFKRLNRNNY